MVTAESPLLINGLQRMEGISLAHASRRFRLESTKRGTYWDFIQMQHSIAFARRKKSENASSQQDGECSSAETMRFHCF